MTKRIQIGFEPDGVIVALCDLLPLKQLKPTLKTTPKYLQVLASVREVGIIEPLVVFPQTADPGTYLVLDGHMRLEVLKDLGQTAAKCIVAIDDEAYTYNRRINRIATIQEHAMILKAIKNGVSEERIAKALNMDLAAIREKRDLLDGICKEAADLLTTRHLATRVFGVLKKMKPMRQIEVAELLVTANNYSVPYTKALLAATHPDMLVDPISPKSVDGLTPEQMARMSKEMETLQRDLKSVEESHGTEVLNFVLARGYLTKLFSNSLVTRYLNQRYSDIFRELQTVIEGASLES